MKITFLTERHREDLRRLHSYCFNLPEGEDWFEPDNYIGAFDGQRLVSSVKINPFEIFFCGRPVKMGGIGAVATLPGVPAAEPGRRFIGRGPGSNEGPGRYLFAFGAVFPTGFTGNSDGNWLFTAGSTRFPWRILRALAGAPAASCR